MSRRRALHALAGGDTEGACGDFKLDSVFKGARATHIMASRPSSVRVLNVMTISFCR